MRILTLCYEFPPLGGGGARVAYGLARQLAALGHHVHLLTLGMRGLPTHEQVDGIEVERVTGWRPRADRASPVTLASYLWAVRSPLRRLLLSGEIDVVHIHFLMPDGALLLAVPELRDLPVVLTAHGSDVPGFNPDRFGLLHRLLRPLWRRIVRRPDRLVCPSRFLGRLVTRHAPDVAPCVVPNGLDLARFQCDRVREPRILAVSRLFPRKGVQELLAALQACPQLPPAVVVGTGPHEAALRQQARPLGNRVSFAGWLDNDSTALRDLYETSTLFVFPSHMENFPVVLLEAMASGLAIVAADIPSAREVLGDTAAYFQVGDAAELATVLRRLVASPDEQRRLGLAARARVESQFGWNAVALRYLDEFVEAARRHGDSRAGMTRPPR